MENLTIKIDVTEPLLEAIRNTIREELESKKEVMQAEPRYYNRKEVCRLLGVSAPTFDTYRKSGRLKVTKIKGRVFVAKTELERFISDAGK